MTACFCIHNCRNGVCRNQKNAADIANSFNNRIGQFGEQRKPRVRCYPDGSFLPQGLDHETIRWAQILFDAAHPAPKDHYRVWDNKFGRLRQ